ncbi:hypothetical protein HPP92_018060 [Vanilla planifolia]|uniref:MSP domain-containing protein n=1 Tax=Vanilla planifolia TaxID=51239 RepID=A0A835QJ80_VANPL|nr:hypothetical protein HPP92_018060 [Vanilla planifolia]
MDRLIKMEPSNEVVVRIEPGRRSFGVVTLRNVMYTMPVAFRLLPLNRARFGIRPRAGIIAPLSAVAVKITYLPPPLPAPLLPDCAPESDDTFYLESVISPGVVFKEGASVASLDAVPADWFNAKKKQVFSDSALRLFYVGSSVLSRLVVEGEVEKLREVLERSDPAWRAADSVDSGGRTLLHLATSRARPDLVQLLIEFNADVQAPDRSGRSPLEVAAASGEDLIAEILLARGASTGRSSAWGPLHHAAAAGQKEILRLLLLKGVNMEETTADGRTALHLAVEERRRDCVSFLLAAGARADVGLGEAGNTPLHAAAVTGDEATARLLIASGCPGLMEARNRKGKTAYEMAVKEGQRNLFDVLRAAERLAAASRTGELNAVVKALDMGAAVDGKDGSGWTALMRAGFKGNVEVMRALLQKGAAMDARDEEGYTALHCAAEAGQLEAVELLVKRGADIDARTAMGTTPVEIAGSLGYAGIVRILVLGGATKAQMPERVASLPPATGKVEKWRIKLPMEEKGGMKEGRLVSGGGVVRKRLRARKI